MHICDAVELVLELARQNIFEEKEVSGIDALILERARQVEACDTLEDFAVNYLGEDD